MRKIREVLRLKLDLKLSDHQVGQSVGLARSTVQDYVIRAKQAGLTWPLPPDLDDHQLEQQLSTRVSRQEKSSTRTKAQEDGD